MVSSVYWFRQFFFFDDNKLNSNVASWQVSCLRLILVSSFLLSLFISYQTSAEAIKLELPIVVFSILSFYLMMAIQLLLSKRFYHFSAHCLLLTIIAAGVFINAFLPDPHLAVMGAIFIYSAPTIAQLLLGFRIAILYLVFNALTFALVLSKNSLHQYTQVSFAFENSYVYIHSLVFLFFNICIPLAVFRATVAAKKLVESHQKKLKLKQQQANLYRQFFAQSKDAKLILDQHDCILDINETAQQWLASLSLTKNDPLLHLIAPYYSEEYGCYLIEGQLYQLMINNVDDETRIAVFEDKTHYFQLQQKSREQQRQISQAKYFDEVVQLPNRQGLLQRAKQLEGQHQPAILIGLELDNQAYIKYTQGRDALAKQYRHLGLLLANWCAMQPQPHQLGYDEEHLLLLVCNLSVEQIDSFCEAINHHIMTVGNLDDKCRIGVCLLTELSELGLVSFEKLQSTLQQHDGKSLVQYFDESIVDQTQRRYHLAQLLKQAIKLEQLSLVFQAKYNSGQQLIGYEALVRWHTDEFGSVSPVEFIEIAEQFDLITELTRFVLNQTLIILKKWRIFGAELVPISVNMTPFDLQQSDFVTFIQQKLLQHDISPTLLQLELTESAFEQQNDSAIQRLAALRDLGIKILIDDFGKGHSSLARLVQLPIDVIKLDKQLIDNICESEKQLILIKVLLSLANNLGVGLLAEGVENKEQFELLTELGCNEYQGYYFAKPLVSDKAFELFARTHTVSH